MRAYPDTSFLVSLYLKDSNTPSAIELSKSLQPVLILTPIHELELNNAIELAVFRREITPDQAAAARRDFEQDVLHWTISPLPPDAFLRVVSLARRHTARYGTRSIDILHVATASALGAEAFLTFDRRQLRLAKAEGLRIGSR
jgi:predicted nucleic acid-binding protein